MTYRRCHNYIYNTFVDIFTLQYLQKIQQSVYIHNGKTNACGQSTLLVCTVYIMYLEKITYTIGWIFFFQWEQEYGLYNWHQHNKLNSN